MFPGTPSLAILTPISFDQYRILLRFRAASSGRCSGACAPEQDSTQSTFIYRLLLQKLENQLRLLIGLRQDRNTRLLQHVGLGQFGRLGREVRILNGAA